MIALTIAELAQIVGGRLASHESHAGRLVAGSVQTDSRLVENGSIFFAMPGDETDGHLFVHKAVELGAALIVAEREVDIDGPVIIVPNGVMALAALARHVVAHVRRVGKLTVIGITGSNGKTTTKNMLKEILSEHGPTVAPIDSFNNHIGAPISMLRVDENTHYLVVEMGASHGGEIAHLVSIARPDISVVLKVGMAHLGEFGGIAATQAAKAEIVTDLRPDAVAILNANDARVASMASVTKARVRWFNGRDGLRAEDVRPTRTGTRFTLICGDGRAEISLQILGEHHVANALAALSVAQQLSLDLDAAIQAIERMPRAERWRMEVLTAPSGATVINDAYNASPDSMAAALRTLQQVKTPNGRTIAVLGEMTELGAAAAQHHGDVGRLVTLLDIDELIVVGEAARDIFVAASREREWKGRLVFTASTERAFDLLDGDLRDSDVLLVKSSKSANLRFVGDRLAHI
ncbi:MAG: UDP-N-acetylmuramoyl-tripeptide--D-alanyl-D-alanine ligase [Microbacteriaceae bacterium]